MEDIYICVSCGKVGEAKDFDFIQTYVATGPDDEDDYDPQCCGQIENLVPAKRCSICDEWFPEDELMRGKCKDHQNSAICPECGEIRDTLLMCNPDYCIPCQIQLIINDIDILKQQRKEK